MGKTHPGERLLAWYKAHKMSLRTLSVAVDCGIDTLREMLRTGECGRLRTACLVERLTNGEIMCAEWCSDGVPVVAGPDPPLLDQRQRGEQGDEEQKNDSPPKSSRRKSTTGQRPTVRRE